MFRLRTCQLGRGCGLDLVCNLHGLKNFCPWNMTSLLPRAVPDALKMLLLGNGTF